MYRTKNEIKCCDVAFLYERLSRDDELDGESNSIDNQKKLLVKVAKEKGYTKTVHFFDDGISGVTMDRPEFNRMMEQLELGKASAVFVKDLSRLGRNYIEVGRLTEEFFPEHNIRLVSVSDNLDTDEGENDLTPIRNLFNEWYARDISKKRRISNKIKGSSGLVGDGIRVFIVELNAPFEEQLEVYPHRMHTRFHDDKVALGQGFEFIRREQWALYHLE